MNHARYVVAFRAVDGAGGFDIGEPAQHLDGRCRESRTGQDTGYRRADLVAALSEAAGTDLEALYVDLVETAGVLDYDALLRGSGLAVRQTDESSYQLVITEPSGRSLLEAITAPVSAAFPDPIGNRR